MIKKCQVVSLAFNSANVSCAFNIAYENWALILPARTGFWYCQRELGFDIANEN